MKYQVIQFSAATLLLLSAACGGGGDENAATTGGASGTTGGASGTTGGASGTTGGAANACDPSAPLMLQAAPEHNYSFSSTLTFPPTTVAPDMELSFDWSTVETDLLGHPFDPLTDVDSVNLMLWKLNEEDFRTKLNDDALVQRELEVVVTLETGQARTSANLFEFTSVGMPLTPEMILPYMNATSYPPDTHTYSIMLNTGTELGKGTRMIQVFKLDPNATNTAVTVRTDSTSLEFTTDLEALQPTRVPAGGSNVTIDWSGMMVNAMGHEFEPRKVTEVLVASYAITPAEMEASFLDLELIAESEFRAQVTSGTSFSLANLMSDTGQPFAGIDSTRTWVVALFCGDCANPAPWYMSILEPCSP